MFNFNSKGEDPVIPGQRKKSTFNNFSLNLSTVLSLEKIDVGTTLQLQTQDEVKMILSLKKNEKSLEKSGLSSKFLKIYF